MGRISALTELTSLANDDYLVVLDSSANIAKKISVQNAFGIPDLGYTAAGETWTYASATTITVPSDATTKYAIGNIVKITQSTGGTKYGTIIVVASTLLTIAWHNGATLENETISSPFYSMGATPLGTSGLQPTSISNPYRFSAYVGSTYDPATGSTKITNNTEEFDPSSNYDDSLYRWVAPFDGVYAVYLQATYGSAGISATEYAQVLIYKNGAEIKASLRQNGSGSSSLIPTPAVFAIIELNAGDYIEGYINTNAATRTLVGGANNSYFTGCLLSLS